MSQYFPKPLNSHFGDSIKVKIDLTNYATKTDIKNISHVDTSSFALKTNLYNLKTYVDQLDIDKLIPIPTDLSKLSNVVKNDVVKKTVYNKLVAKVDNIDTSDFVLKTIYNADRTELENKIPDTSGLVKKTNYNTKITELENKIANISNLTTKTALTAIENKIPSDTSKFNTLATNVFNARLTQNNLTTKTDFDAKLLSLNKKITQNKSNTYLLKMNSIN